MYIYIYIYIYTYLYTYKRFLVAWPRQESLDGKRAAAVVSLTGKAGMYTYFNVN